MSSTEPMDSWESIAWPSSPNHEILRRVAPEYELDFYRGKLYGGGYFLRLVLSTTSKNIALFPTLRNVEIYHHEDASGGSTLTFALKSQKYFEQFRALCADLLSSTRLVTKKNESDALPILHARIKRWQELFQRENSDLLSTSEQLGLLGELLFLKDFFLKNTDALASLNAWCGPSGSEQDFQYNGSLFEVKSQNSAQDNFVRISSEHQLDLVSGNIVLVHQLFGTTQPDTGIGYTLRELVGSVEEIVDSTMRDASDLLQARLLEANYFPLDEYDRRRYELVHRNYYKVTNEFPHINAHGIPNGISNVSYDLSIHACRPFMENPAIICEMIFYAY